MPRKLMGLLAVFGLVVSAAGAEAWNGPGLLLTKEGVSTMREKADRHDWAKAVAEQVVKEARGALEQTIAPPAAGGGWTHNYVCKKCTSRLRFDAHKPHEHLCSKCNITHRGKDVDDAWVTIVHTRYGRRAETCALGYALTEEERFAEYAGEILRWYADHYADFPVHGKWAGRGRVMGQSLGEATWLIKMLHAFDLISPALAEGRQKRIIEGLFLPAARHIEKYNMRIHNIECWQASARLMAGIVGGDEAIRDKAIASLRKNIQRGITEEGFWYEGSPGYHDYTLRALTPALLTAKHQGIDLGEREKLLKMYTVPATLSLPGYRVPPINDGGGVSLGSSAGSLEVGCYVFETDELRNLLSLIYRKELRDRTSREALQWGPQRLPKRAALSLKSARMDGIGLVVLRAGGMTAILKAGGNHGGHDHCDRLNLILADKNRTWLPDLGTSSYGHRLYRLWYRTTLAHNTLEVDGVSQQIGIKGKIVFFHSEPDFAATAVECENIYQGVHARRTVILIGGLAFDRFRVESETRHRYVLSARGDGALERDDEVQEPYRKTMAFLDWLWSGDGAETLEVRWQDKRKRLLASYRMDVKGDGRRGFDIVEGPGFPGGAPMRQVIARCEGKNATFWAVYRNSAVVGAKFEIVPTPQGADIKLMLGGRKRVIRLHGNGEGVERLPG